MDDVEGGDTGWISGYFEIHSRGSDTARTRRERKLHVVRIC